ncbi:PEP-CTERM sorting domain-containing protein [Paucibacter sp. APW11]|uniref:PEP-CTERM sorting domain-containing protein n=1 Tax=Roseateles aquae TaxID=3077235 RepID=A0ABU3PJ91_9BURK|nr:PEP-CTERM sorting domain-containing protein [Paucibacter sp. APW11]MDT9002227.1 PEP-CTERM sorting domain-containing protein [Paucibacter sp. APW11]
MHPAHLSAALLLSSSVFAAQASTQSTLNIGPVTVSLSDLDAHDGVTPSLIWDSNVYLQTRSWGNQQSGWTTTLHPNYVEYSTVWQDRQQWQSSSGPGAGSLSTNLGGGQQSVSNQGAGFSGIQLSHTVSGGANFTSFASSFQAFTLSAHSQVTFDVEYSGSLRSDAFTGHLVMPDSFSVPAFSSLSYNVALVVNDWQWGTDSAFASWWDKAALNKQLDHQHVSYTLQNTGDTDKTFNFMVQGYAQAIELSAPVPEPSSYIMMLLGLLGLGAAARRCR